MKFSGLLTIVKQQKGSRIKEADRNQRSPENKRRGFRIRKFLLSFIIYSVQFSFAHESFHLYEISECYSAIREESPCEKWIRIPRESSKRPPKKKKIIAQVIVRKSLDIASSFNLD